jgi:hypothetical protein
MGSVYYGGVFLGGVKRRNHKMNCPIHCVCPNRQTGLTHVKGRLHGYPAPPFSLTMSLQEISTRGLFMMNALCQHAQFLIILAFRIL